MAVGAVSKIKAVLRRECYYFSFQPDGKLFLYVNPEGSELFNQVLSLKGFQHHHIKSNNQLDGIGFVRLYGEIPGAKRISSADFVSRILDENRHLGLENELDITDIKKAANKAKISANNQKLSIVKSMIISLISDDHQHLREEHIMEIVNISLLLKITSVSVLKHAIIMGKSK